MEYTLGSIVEPDQAVAVIVQLASLDGLAEHLVDLIRRAERLGLVTGLNTNGRRLAETRYDLRVVLRGLDAAYEASLRQRGNSLRVGRAD